MIMPYLNFSGNCEEAFLFYQRAFDSKEPLLSRYSDAPDSLYPNLTEDEKNKIMHGYIMLTETGGISGADALWSFEPGSAINIHVICSTKEQGEKAFNVLAEEGEIISKLIKNPPHHDNSMSGTVKDKFGFTFVISV